MKKIIIIGLLILILLSAVLLVIKNKKQTSVTPVVTPQLARPTVTQRPFNKPTEEKMEINGVKVNNLYKDPLRENRQYDVVIVENNKYQIVYLQQFQQFLITILDPDFNTTKLAAENDFLEQLGVTKDDACKLPVKISTPRSVNADLAGKIFPLSFCSATP